MEKKKPGKFKVRAVFFLVVLLLMGSVGIFFVIYKFSLSARQRVIDSRFTPAHHVNFNAKDISGTERKEGSDNKISLRVAVAPVVSPEASLTLYKGLVDYIGNALGRKAVLILRSSYAEINELIRIGECSLAFVCSYPYIRGKLDFGMQVLAVPMIKGEITYHSYFIVPSSSKVKSLLDLREKRFASADLLSTSGWIYPAMWLKNHSEDPERFFSEHVIARSHDRVIYLVTHEDVDGAAVDSIVYEQIPEDMRAKTKVIFKSPPFGMPPFVVHPGIEDKLKNDLLEALLNMHKEPEGKEALSHLGIDKFVIPDENLYESVEKLVKKWESRK